MGSTDMRFLVLLGEEVLVAVSGVVEVCELSIEDEISEEEISEAKLLMTSVPEELVGRE
jgi:hypothetical protein